MLRLVGAGNPPLRRFRVGLELVMSGHRELDGMIASHAKLAQTLAQQLDLPAALDAVGSAYEQWDGRGWPGTLRATPSLASRIAQLAEYVEVAHRAGGSAAAAAVARQRSGKQFDPKLAALVFNHAGEILEGLDSVRAWDAVIASEPALAVVLSEEQFDAALLAIANFVDLKSPFTLGHSAAVAELSRAQGPSWGCRLPTCECYGGQVWCTTSDA